MITAEKTSLTPPPQQPLPIDRVAADRPFHSGKHKRHGMDAQVITDRLGRLLWASPALPGAVHDVRATREHGIIAAPAVAGIPCWVDTAYQGAKGTLRVPYRSRRKTISAGKKAVNRSHAKIRALVEQAAATLKSWPLLRKLRCSSTRITKLVQGRTRPAPDLFRLRLAKTQWRRLRGRFSFLQQSGLRRRTPRTLTAFKRNETARPLIPLRAPCLAIEGQRLSR